MLTNIRSKYIRNHVNKESILINFYSVLVINIGSIDIRRGSIQEQINYGFA